MTIDDQPRNDGKRRLPIRPTGDQVRDWVARYRRGENFSQIAERAGVERRTVSRAIRQYEAGGALDEAAGALRSIIAEHLRAHLEDLGLAARALLRTTAPPSLSGRPTGERRPSQAKQAVVNELERQFLPTQRKYVTPDREGYMWDPLDQRQARRRAEGAWTALTEHLPGLEQLLYELGSTVNEANWEQVYQRLEDLLAPPRLDKELVLGRCPYCPHHAPTRGVSRTET
jgi:DNA-binding transcriptional ArsR family regulator